METWKPIKGYEGLYEVSNNGKVRSLNYGGKTGVVKELYLKKHKDGYRQVELAKGHSTKMFTVHRLVAGAFIPNPEGLPVVNHIDEDKQNNNVENLEWCSVRYNIMYSAARKQGVVSRKGKHFSKAVKQLDLKGNVVREWKNTREVSLENNMNQWSIIQCCEGRRKTAYGYRWQYAI